MQPFVPLDVPEIKKAEFIKNYQAITVNNRLLLFACDQKIEHLNSSFYGPTIDVADNSPTHLFEIANSMPIGACAMHLGLLTRYAHHYHKARFIVKLNGKTNIIKNSEKDPLSAQLWSVKQVIELKEQSKIAIMGVGYTVYLGSEHEAIMLEQAAQIIYQAHQQGLIAIIWMYPRGKHVLLEREGNLIAGCAGIATALGADFVKLNVPDSDNNNSSNQWLTIAAQAAGTTKILCSGGPKIEESSFIEHIKEQLQHGAQGIALGRNLHQRSLHDAQKLINTISEILQA